MLAFFTSFAVHRQNWRRQVDSGKVNIRGYTGWVYNVGYARAILQAALAS